MPNIVKYFALLSLFMTPAFAETLAEKLNQAALKRLDSIVVYNGKYIKIAYPNGDVPKNIGVCTDVVIRSYRALNIDLQELVHRDMKKHFDKYPSRRIWGMKGTDTNIDHRRVPNLRVFFKRNGISLKVTKDAKDFKKGDVVSWVLPNNLPHIGIVTDTIAPSGNPMIVHNIGMGPQLEDMLFEYRVTGHYRYFPKK